LTFCFSTTATKQLSNLFYSFAEFFVDTFIIIRRHPTSNNFYDRRLEQQICGLRSPLVHYVAILVHYVAFMLWSKKKYQLCEERRAKTRQISLAASFEKFRVRLAPPELARTNSFHNIQERFTSVTPSKFTVIG